MAERSAGAEEVGLKGDLVGKEGQGNGDLGERSEGDQIFGIARVGEFIVELRGRIDEEMVQTGGSGRGAGGGAGGIRRAEENGGGGKGGDGAGGKTRGRFEREGAIGGGEDMVVIDGGDVGAGAFSGDGLGGKQARSGEGGGRKTECAAGEHGG